MPGSDAEDICEAIARRRGCGAVHCGITGGAASVTEVARAFGLRADPLCYHEIDEVSARAVAAGVLGRDLAYRAELLPPAEASALAARFFERCIGPGCRFYSNRGVSPGSSGGWSPATDATFDGGVIVVGGARSGCLWVEDED